LVALADGQRHRVIAVECLDIPEFEIGGGRRADIVPTTAAVERAQDRAGGAGDPGHLRADRRGSGR
jgi:hypothetical protein